MNIAKKRLFLTVIILLISSRSFCSENAGTSSWFGGMYNRVKNYLDISGWSKRIGGIPLLYGMRNYNPQQQGVHAIRVPSRVRSAQYEIRKAEGAPQEEFEKIQQDLTERLQHHQLTPPRATWLESKLKTLSADETKEKNIFVDAVRRLDFLKKLTNSEQEISIIQLQNFNKSLQDIERNLESLQLSRNRPEVQQIIKMKDDIKAKFEQLSSKSQTKKKNARKKEKYVQKR
jgi:hypothetical protein